MQATLSCFVRVGKQAKSLQPSRTRKIMKTFICSSYTGNQKVIIDEAELLRLEGENKRLRQVISESLAKLNPEKQAKFKPERIAARKLVARHDPEEATAGRHHWMVVTVPEKPVSGEDLVVYFNRNASDSLRDQPNVHLKFGFNKWELPHEGSDVVPLSPTSISRDKGSWFWSCRIKVPEDSHQLNFVFTDGEGQYENNSGQDFTYPVEEGITWDDWASRN